ncbi:MAG: SUF system Fe-S cluster assembly regulator [Pseudomonadota bacterium]|nr:SUF system Fe-S cluster assembly regulator [Pseudomonadota bacterium]
MLKMGKLTDYATVIMSYLAQNPGQVHAASELALVVGVGAPTALKVLKTLARAGLLQSQRGTKGGYQLTRPATQITVADILQAMEGPIGLTECGSSPGACLRESRCGVRTNWQRISQAVGEALARVTLAEMAAPPPHPVHFVKPVVETAGAEAGA